MESPGMQVNARTGVVGVIGYPVGHSLSPQIHNAAFRDQRVDLVYVAFSVSPEQLGAAVEGIRALGLRGVNVTVPHKETIRTHLDDLDPLARRIGAVNTVVNNGGRLTGHNTDVAGFQAALRALRPGGGRGLNCLLTGAGGAARAVLAGLVEEGAREVCVYNRTLERAVRLCAEAASWGKTACRSITEAEMAEVGAAADLIVNATSVGLMGAGEVKESAVPVDIISSHHVVVDLVYGQHSTALVEAARAVGASAADGKEMLVMQAASSYQLWTGLLPPVETMRKSVGSGER